MRRRGSAWCVSAKRFPTPAASAPTAFGLRRPPTLAGLRANATATSRWMPPLSMTAANISGMMNAKYNGLVAAGIAAASPSGALSWVASRRSYIQGQLTTVAASFAITSNGGNNFSTNRNYLTLGGTAPIGIKTIGSLHLACANAGSSSGDSIWQYTTTLTTNAQYTLSYWYLPSTNGSGLTIRLSGSTPTAGILSSHSIAPSSAGLAGLYTPGAANSVRTNLSAMPLVWLNEIQPNNVTGPADNLGDRDPWVELYNSGAGAVDLTGFYLSDNYTNLTRWAFPGGTLIEPGQFRLVWLDNEPG